MIHHHNVNTGNGSSRLSTDTLRRLLYTVSESYLAICADGGTSSEQIVATLAQPADGSTCQMEARLDAMENALRKQLLVANRDMLAGAFLIISNACLLDQLRGPGRADDVLSVVSQALGMERVSMWAEAEKLASELATAESDDGYIRSLRELRDAWNNRYSIS